MVHTLLTPEQLELVLPMLGASLLLNLVLIAALVFRAVRQRLWDGLETFRLGLRLWLRGRRRV